MTESMFQNLSQESLDKIKRDYPDYIPQVEAEEKRRAELEAEAMQAFEAEAAAEAERQAINDKLLACFVELFPNKPDDLSCLVFTWSEVERQVTTGKGKNAKTETVKEWAPEIIRNAHWTREKPDDKPVKKAGATAGKRKNAQTVSKVNGTTLEPIGNFRSGAEACKHLGLDYAGNSANRVLKDQGYILQPYDGEDFTIPAEA